MNDSTGGIRLTVDAPNDAQLAIRALRKRPLADRLGWIKHPFSAAKSRADSYAASLEETAEFSSLAGKRAIHGRLRNKLPPSTRKPQ